MCFIDAGVEMSHGVQRGRGLFATKPIPKGTCLMSVPKDVWYRFSAAHHRESAPAELVGHIDELDKSIGEGRGKLAAATLTALGLVYSPEDELVKRYRNLLPEDQDDETFNPSLWSTDQLGELENSPAKRTAIAFRNVCEAMAAHLALKLPRHEYVRLSCLVRSRAVSFETKEDDFFFGLIPAVDLANHDSLNPTAMVDFDGLNGPCVLRAASDLEKGDEITFEYGPLGNAELLRVYGFATDDNPHDFVTLDPEAVLFAANSKDDPYTMPLRGPQTIESLIPMDTLQLHQQTLPENSLAALRVRYLTPEEATIHNPFAEKTIRKFVSITNETKAIEALAYIVEKNFLRSHTTWSRFLLNRQGHAASRGYIPVATIEDDMAMLKKPRIKDTWLHHAVRTRLGEKRIWVDLLHRLEQARGALDPRKKNIVAAPPP